MRATRESGSAAESAARRHKDAASWRAVWRGAPRQTGAHHKARQRRAARHTLSFEGSRNSKGTTGEPGASTNNAGDDAWLFGN